MNKEEHKNTGKQMRIQKTEESKRGLDRCSVRGD